MNAVYAGGATDIWAGGSVKPTSDNGDRAWWINHSSDGVNFVRAAGDYGLNPDLQDVSYPSKDVAYVVGQGSSIGKTTDGGDTWAWSAIDTGTNGHFFDAVSCPTEQHCWIGGRFALVYATSDGGQTWTRQPLPGYGSTVYAIEMLDINNGHVGGNPNMFRTTNGGETWLATVVDGSIPNVDISMIDIYAGYTAGRQTWYRWTTSGGQTWRYGTTTSDIGPDIYLGVQALDADKNGEVDNAWMVGCVGPLVNHECKDPRTGVVAHTADNGATWAYQSLPADTPPLIDIVMFDARRGWIGGENGVLLYTDSGGAAWETVDSSLPPANSLITSLDFADEEHGLGSAFGGYIIRYAGPGRTLGSYEQAGSIQVDGSPADWYQGGKLVLDASTASTVLGDPPLPGPTDLSADLYSRWIFPTLYLMAEISDDVVADDTFRVAIDGLNDQTLTGEDDHILLINADGTYTNTLQPDQTGAFTVGVGRSDDGWVVEMAIPALTLRRLDFFPGDEVGFNVALDDDDGAGVAHTLILEGRQLADKPATFANIAVVGDTIIYQNGANGYDGAADTYLEQWWDATGNTPRGSENRLWLMHRSGRTVSDILVRFALDNLPQGAHVLEGTLDLYVEGSTITAAPFDVTAYRVTRPWNEQTATWKQADAGQFWANPGAFHPTLDHDQSSPLGQSQPECTRFQRALCSGT